MQVTDFKPTKLFLLTLLIASMLILMGGAAVAPALPEIGMVFPQYDSFVINLIISLPSLAIVLAGLVIGALADRLGKVRVLLVSLALFGVAGISGYFINDIPTLLVGRFFVGVGIAGISCCCTALVAEYYSGPERVKVLGYQVAAMGMGALVLELSGGFLAGFGWHYPFLIYGLGFLLFLLALVSLREPVHIGSEQGDVVTEHRTDKGLVAFSYAVIFVAMLLMFLYPSKLPEYMEVELGSSITVTGLMLSVTGICNALASVAHNHICHSLRETVIMTVGFLFIGLCVPFFILEPSCVTITIAAVMMGIGLGLITPAVLNVLAENSTPSTSGRIMGGYSTCFYMGQFLSTFLIAGFISVYGGLCDSVFVTVCALGFVMALVCGVVSMTKGKTSSV